MNPSIIEEHQKNSHRYVASQFDTIAYQKKAGSGVAGSGVKPSKSDLRIFQYESNYVRSTGIRY